MSFNMRRLSWGGLLRNLEHDPKGNYYHNHIYMVDRDGHRKYLQLKRMADGTPYFVEVREQNDHK